MRIHERESLTGEVNATLPFDPGAEFSSCEAVFAGGSRYGRDEIARCCVWLFEL